MRLAVISDVHGNEAALDAVMRQIERVGVDTTLCAGDAVGLGPKPREVVDRLRDEAILTIRGNHEIEVLAEIEGDGSGKEHIEWTAGVLKKRHVRWMRELPSELEVDLGGPRLLVVHGSPRSPYDYVFPSLTARSLEAFFPSGDRPDVLVAGHTHLPFVKRVGGTVVVNAGSAGKPIDGDSRVAWALLETRKGTVRGSVRRVEYPVEETLRALRKAGFRKARIRALQHSIRRWPPRGGLR